MPTEITGIVSALTSSALSFVAIALVVVLFAWVRGTLISRREFDDMKADRDLYRDMTLSLLQKVDKHIEVNEQLAQKVGR
jgi:hypothetical protein